MDSFQTVCFVLSTLYLVVSGREYHPGDIRLTDGTATRGRLELYFNGVWGTVCLDPFSQQLGAARTACRQLGYQDALKVGTVQQLGIPEAPSYMLFSLYSLVCPYNNVMDLNNEPEHVLRCDYRDSSSNGCTHDKDMAIECTVTSKYTAPYDKEVRLVEGGTGYTSSGIVEVFLNNRWGTVCYDNMNTANAWSICRQLGYTQAKHYDLTLDSLPDVQPVLKDLLCSKYNWPCLSKCFNYPSASDNITCDYGITTVNCTFDVSQLYPTNYIAGNESLCTHFSPDPPTAAPFVRIAKIVGGVMGGVVLIAIAITILLCCCCFMSGCPLYSWREKKSYAPI